MDDDQTYCIRRFYFNGDSPVVMQTGLTLEEAQEHCNDPETSVDGCYFDGYDREN